MTDAARKMQAARTALVLDDRTAFWGVLALRLKLVPDPTCGTAWVDGVSLGYNPEYVESLTMDETIGLMAHEVGHPVLGHPWRRDGREPRRFNEACDYALNPIIRDAGFTLPDNVLLDERYEGKSAEWIFDRLAPKQGGDDGAEGDGGGPGDDESDDEGDGQGDSPGDGPDGSEGDEGGDGDGTSPGTGSPSGEWDGVRDAPADAVEQEATEEEWKRAITEAANAAEARGALPGHLRRLVKERTRSVMDWRSLLRRFMQEASQADYTWSRPNRAFVAHGLYLPSLHAEGMGPVVIGFDTSTSIDDITVSLFGAEVRSVMDEVRPREVHVVYCDTRVAHVDVYAQGEPVEIQPHGGGGTDFRPVFGYAANLDEEPAALIYLTDLDGPFPEYAPGYPVFWATINRRRAPWGETVEIDV